MSEYRSIKVERTARFLVSGPGEVALREVWFVLHGYAQRAEEFLEEFQIIQSPGRMFVAVEGLSRFYRRGSSGEVGASWMTSVARDDEIADYIGALDAIYSELGLDERRDVRVHVLGFSQGCATAFRWALMGRSRIDRLIGWAGDVPPDLDLDQHASALADLDLQLIFGARDRFVSEDRLAEQMARLAEAGVARRLWRFEGAHRMDRETLTALAQESPAGC